jgi:hypothetical protein
MEVEARVAVSIAATSLGLKSMVFEVFGAPRHGTLERLWSCRVTAATHGEKIVMLNLTHAPELRYLRTKEAARSLSLSPLTLEKHRTCGTGPLYRKIGGRVVHAIVDLQVWADSGLRSSISDPRRGPTPPRRDKPIVEADGQQNADTSHA